MRTGTCPSLVTRRVHGPRVLGVSTTSFTSGGGFGGDGGAFDLRSVPTTAATTVGLGGGSARAAGAPVTTATAIVHPFIVGPP
jgi:hypothetical protein